MFEDAIVLQSTGGSFNMGDLNNGRYGLRARKPFAVSSVSAGFDQLLQAATCSSRVVIFSGSGLSASSGMSTFSTKGGLYERAQHKFGLPDGKKLFCYSFFDKQRQDVQPFFADIHKEASKAAPAEGHRAVAELFKAGCLLRHYTLNIDGLAEAAGMPTWHPNFNPEGVTVEMHGSIKQLVCPTCACVTNLTPPLLKALRAKTKLDCTVCGQAALRWKVMMYDDDEGSVITPEGVFDLWEEDLAVADLVIWVGLSFEQSATIGYFRRVRNMLMEHGRLTQVPQAVINVSDEAMWNLLSSCSNQGDLNVIDVTASSDMALPKVAEVMVQSRDVPARPAPLHPVLLSLPDSRKRRHAKKSSCSSAEGDGTTTEERCSTGAASSEAKSLDDNPEMTSPSRQQPAEVKSERPEFVQLRKICVKPLKRKHAKCERTSSDEAVPGSATAFSGSHKPVSSSPKEALRARCESPAMAVSPPPRKAAVRALMKCESDSMELAETSLDVQLLQEFAQRTGAEGGEADKRCSNRPTSSSSPKKHGRAAEYPMQTAVDLLSSMINRSVADVGIWMGPLDDVPTAVPILDALAPAGGADTAYGSCAEATVEHPCLPVTFPRRRRSQRGQLSKRNSWKWNSSGGGGSSTGTGSGDSGAGTGTGVNPPGAENSSSCSTVDREVGGDDREDAWASSQPQVMHHESAAGWRLSALVCTIEQRSLVGMAAEWDGVLDGEMGDDGFRVRRTRRGEY